MSRVFDLPADVHFGDAKSAPIDWRAGLHSVVDEDPDDEELPETPEDVTAILGFDPKELGSDDGEAAIAESFDGAALESSGEHWITIHGDDEGGGHKVLLDRDGKIVGGSIPPSMRGVSIKHLGHAFRALKDLLKSKLGGGKSDTDKRGGKGGPSGRSDTPQDGGPVARASGASHDAAASQGGEGERQPARSGTPKALPAEIHRVNEKLDRVASLFRKNGQHEQAAWLDKVKSHVNDVGVEAALEALGESRGGGKQDVQYQGAAAPEDFTGGLPAAEFAQKYLERTGITLNRSSRRIEGKRSISSEPKEFRGYEADKPGDFQSAEPNLVNKLDEAKKLPGLESSEDINKIAGHEVTHLSPDVRKKLDDKYGAGRWIVKAYGNEAAAGYGIFFPQYAEQIERDAQSTIHHADKELSQYGLSLYRDKDGRLAGLKGSDGTQYKFGSRSYANTIFGHARELADRAAEAAQNEHGAELPGGGKEFMAQPAFAAVGVSDADRAAGKTIAPGEGRVHITTQNGVASIVPHATWIKNAPLPVVFENDDTRAMAKAAVDAINALPASERQGQIYAPDVMKTDKGYRVVEANPSNDSGQSGYLTDNPFTIDSYVSHLTGQDPAHVRFIRSMLTKRERGQANQLTIENRSGGR